MAWRFIRYFFIFLLLFGSLATAGAAWFYYNWLNTPLQLDERAFILNIPANSNLIQVSSELGLSGYLRYPRLLVLHARLTDSEHIQAGEYSLQQGDTPAKLLQLLTSGEVVQHRVSLIEGWTSAEMLQQLQGDPRLQNDLQNAIADQLPQLLNLDVEHHEGWFYPDTYQFVRGERLSSLLRRAHQRMQDVLAEEWLARGFGVPYESPYEALIMASIVEKETGVPYERGAIAGVFVRRLQQGMRLQTDPTVIYGLGDRYDGNITRAHLREATPWNTYVIRGLPPTPIANPGRAAIHAALNPEPGSALFFVARGDGSHVFSDTLEQHEAAVRQFQIEQRAENYQSAPQL